MNRCSHGEDIFDSGETFLSQWAIPPLKTQCGSQECKALPAVLLNQTDDFQRQSGKAIEAREVLGCLARFFFSSASA